MTWVVCVTLGLQTSGCGREALWPSGQYAVVGKELREGFRTVRVLTPVAGDVTEIFEISFSVAFITFAASAESLLVSLSCHPAGNQPQFLSPGLIIFL